MHYSYNVTCLDFPLTLSWSLKIDYPMEVILPNQLNICLFLMGFSCYCCWGSRICVIFFFLQVPSIYMKLAFKQVWGGSTTEFIYGFWLKFSTNMGVICHIQVSLSLVEVGHTTIKKKVNFYCIDFYYHKNQETVSLSKSMIPVLIIKTN